MTGVLAYRAQLGRVGGGREIEGMCREEGGKDGGMKFYLKEPNPNREPPKRPNWAPQHAKPQPPQHTRRGKEEKGTNRHKGAAGKGRGPTWFVGIRKREGWVLLKIPRGDIDGVGEVK